MSSGIATGRKRGLSHPLPQPLTLPTTTTTTTTTTNMENLSNLMHGIANVFTSTTSTSTDVSSSPPPPPPPPHGEITCWLIDTRIIWPGKDIWSAPGATEAMSLISMQEQKAISTKMFIQDARMSLASALLKRLYISQALEIPWKDVRLSRKGDPKHGKPCAVDGQGRPIEGLDFNVSHQAGLVALIGWNDCERRRRYDTVAGGVEASLSRDNSSTEIMVGVDIVCVNERDDYRVIDVEGMDGWVDIYDSVFSDEERWSMKYDLDHVPLEDGTLLTKDHLGRHDRCVRRNQSLALKLPSGREFTFNSNALIDAKLRRFYTYFCYKEAYIKLSGEALLAPWLKHLEFSNVRSPSPGDTSSGGGRGGGGGGGGKWGEVVSDVEVQLKKKSVEDVEMKIMAFEKDIMLSTAIQGVGVHQGMEVPDFTMIDLRRDVLGYARRSLNVITTTPVVEER